MNKRIFDLSKHKEYYDILRGTSSKKAPKDVSATEKRRFHERRRNCLDNFSLVGDHLRFKSGNDSKLVISIEDAFPVIARAHLSVAHKSAKATWAVLKDKVYGLKREEVEWLVHKCKVCKRRRNKHGQVTAVIPTATNARAKSRMVPLYRKWLDLVDLSYCSANGFAFILVERDHMSNYVHLKPLKSVNCLCIARCLDSWCRLDSAPKFYIHHTRSPELQLAVTILNSMRCGGLQYFDDPRVANVGLSPAEEVRSSIRSQIRLFETKGIHRWDNESCMNQIEQYCNSRRLSVSESASAYAAMFASEREQGIKLGHRRT